MANVLHPAVAAAMLSRNALIVDQFGDAFDLVADDGQPHKLTTPACSFRGVRPEFCTGRYGLTADEMAEAQAVVAASRSTGQPVVAPVVTVADTRGKKAPK